MRIERVELRIVRLRLHEPFRISSGTTHHRRILIAALEGEGARAWGECVADDSPHYAYETVDTATLVIRRYLAPAILGRDFESAAHVAAALDAAAKGHPMAKAALEMSAWDLEARLRGVPLARLLGGTRDAVPAGVSIGIQDDLPALLERIETFAARGYRRVKIKIAPGWDLDILRQVRARFPDLPLSADANAAYSAADADRLAAIDELGLTMLEQPFGADELLEHADLQARMATAVCLDESITSPARCALAIHLRAAGTVNIKPGRVGGHAASRRIHDLCAAAGIPVWCGGMLESGIGRAHNVALASLPNFRLPGDTSESRRYWERDVVEPPFQLRPDGTLAVPDSPGIGVAVDEDFLARTEESRIMLDAP